MSKCLIFWFNLRILTCALFGFFPFEKKTRLFFTNLRTSKNPLLINTNHNRYKTEFFRSGYGSITSREDTKEELPNNKLETLNLDVKPILNKNLSFENYSLQPC